MNAKQARDILKCTIVMLNGDPLCKGTVMEVGYTGFLVRWENGTNEWFEFSAAKHVDEWYPQPQEEQP